MNHKSKISKDEAIYKIQEIAGYGVAFFKANQLIINNNEIFLSVIYDEDFFHIESHLRNSSIILTESLGYLLLKELSKMNIGVFYCECIDNYLKIDFGVTEYILASMYVDTYDFLISIVKNVYEDLHSIRDVFNKYRKHEKNIELINNLWNKVINENDSNMKGKLFEIFITRLIEIDDNLELYRKNMKTRSEEIDVIIKPSNKLSIWSNINSPLIIIECKNWKKKVGSKTIRDFKSKIENRSRIICNLGVFFSLSGFSKAAYDEVLGYRNSPIYLILVDKSDIKKILNSKLTISELLENKLI